MKQDDILRVVRKCAANELGVDASELDDAVVLDCDSLSGYNILYEIELELCSMGVDKFDSSKLDIPASGLSVNSVVEAVQAELQRMGE